MFILVEDFFGQEVYLAVATIEAARALESDPLTWVVTTKNGQEFHTSSHPAELINPIVGVVPALLNTFLLRMHFDPSDVPWYEKVPITAWNVRASGHADAVTHVANAFSSSEDSAVLYPSGWIEDFEGSSYNSIESWIAFRAPFSRKCREIGTRNSPVEKSDTEGEPRGTEA